MKKKEPEPLKRTELIRQFHEAWRRARDGEEGYRLAGPIHKENLEFLNASEGQPDTLSFKRRLKQLEKVLCADEEDANRVRASCGLAMNAEDAPDFGIFISLAFTCMEGLLLDPTKKEDVTARLVEAVSYLLGRNAEEVTSLRQAVKDLYDQRSAFAHSGITNEMPRTRSKVQELLRRVLRVQIERLSEAS